MQPFVMPKTPDKQHQRRAKPRLNPGDFSQIGLGKMGGINAEWYDRAFGGMRAQPFGGLDVLWAGRYNAAGSAEGARQQRAIQLK